MNLLIAITLSATLLLADIPDEPKELYRPTYAELIDFLNRNPVNKNRYIPGEYVCWNFACDLQRDAHAEGMYMDYWYIATPSFAHALVGVLTSDKGIVFIEPQNDHPMKVEIGIRYWQWLRGPYFYNYYTEDDTITTMVGWGTQTRCNIMRGDVVTKAIRKAKGV